MNPKLLTLLFILITQVSLFAQKSVDPEKNNEKETIIEEITIYPIPAIDILKIESDQSGKSFQLKIVALNGTIVLEKQVSNGEHLDLSDLNNGLYFLNINDGTNGYSKKLVVQK